MFAIPLVYSTIINDGAVTVANDTHDNATADDADDIALILYYRLP
jgi:hypothetical protein